MDFIIVGAGCAGLVMACQLKRKLPASTFAILEREPSLGGTWYHNSYPGCAVAIPCVTYGMSFDPSRTYCQWYPSQCEILQYLHHIASKYNIEEHMQLNTEFVRASWDDDTKLWTVVYKDRQRSEMYEQQTKFLISAIGLLVEPSYEGVQDLDRFGGDVIHANRWNDNIKLEGKRVVVVGNGASGTQIVPSIVQQVGSLTQLIRTPQAYMKTENPKLSRLVIWLIRYMPLFLLAWRYWSFITLERRYPQFQSSTTGEKIRKKTVQQCHEYTRLTAPRKYWDLLLPNYNGSCKRIILDFGYLVSLNAPNLQLLQDPAVACDHTGVLTQSGKHFEADVLIFATGYQSALHHLDITGRHGISLNQKWKGDVKKHYKTIAVSGFPNFFMLYGPNAAPQNMSAIYCFENHIDLIMRVMRPVLNSKAASVEVEAQAEEDFTERLQSALEKGAWSTCRQRNDTKNNAYMYPWSNTAMYYETHSKEDKAWVYRKQVDDISSEV
ncbi:FAD/NAD(P)-binding domain-containing protein [Lophiostoma macrostomum CBS 122681]|uniref:FAD/NAD(P)-binding domain-containing protein n=1 Tax=Lophiostoma macrostomum CBS 122681 TaxID=1314788 RepID=A0A6A6TEW2_9PLEO|nr:FAD/NAD(P)-binding domain-containing protein [Lophiostoma macrostomum CBS 122681]